MRSDLIIKGFLIGVLCLFTLVSVISLTFAGVGGSPHDLSDAGTGGFTFTTPEVCVFCHTPHGGNNDIRPDTFVNVESSIYNVGTGAPMLLWNRALANLAGSAEYTVYRSSTMNGEGNQVRIYSLLCLSCHDGVSSMNVLFNNPSTMRDANADGYVDPEGSDTGPPFLGHNQTYMGVIGDSAVNIGGRTDLAATEDVNLADDHPVSIDYDQTRSDADGGLTPPSSFVDVTNGIVYSNPISEQRGTIQLFQSTDVAFGGTGDVTSIECPTCHDVHNHGVESQGTLPFLAVSNSGSAMCLACHNK
jgi:hypothetical protein